MRAVLSLHAMSVLASIHIYPLKSGAPLALDQGVVESRGLAGDRRWMVVDANGKFITGRQQPRLTLVSALPDGGALQVTAPGMPALTLAPPPADSARIDTDVWGAAVRPLLGNAASHAWISAFVGVACRLVYMDDACTRRVKAKYGGKYGTDDDVVSFADAFPLLLISQAALDQLNARLAAPVPILRFRPNLVVSGTTPHAEDGWKRIRIGAIELDVVKACVRCVFTTVEFERGAFDPSGEPLRTLLKYRRGDEGVTFGQNVIPRGRGILRRGDAVEVLA